MRSDWWHGVGAGLLCAMIWGLQSVVTRQAVAEGMTAADLTIVRYLVSGVILLPVALRLKPSLVGHLGWQKVLILSLLAGAPYSLVIVGGLGLAPAAHHAVITPGLIPIFAALAALSILGERAGTAKWLGLVTVGIGIALFFRDSWMLLPSRERAWQGDVLFVVAAAMWTAFGLLSQTWKADPLETTASICVLSLLSTPILLWVMPIEIDKASLGTIVSQGFYQGFLVGAVSLVAYTRAVKFIGSAAAAMFLPLMPLIAGAGGYLFLGEQLTRLEIAGMLVVVIGMAMALRAPRLGQARA